MNWSIGNIVAIGMRIIQHRNEVARVGQKVIAKIVEAEILFGEVRALIEKVAPELLIDLKITPLIRTAPEPTPTYDVTWVQQSLNHLLHPDVKLKVDGIMGERTREAIKIFQGRSELTVDGWLGPLTMAALDADIRSAHARGSR